MMVFCDDIFGISHDSAIYKFIVFFVSLYQMERV